MNSSNFFNCISKSKSHIYIKYLLARTQRTQCKTTLAAIPEFRKTREDFLKIFPVICETIAKKSKFADVPEVAEWTKKVLENNVPGGKLTRGLTTIITYELLAKPEELTEENLIISKAMGWCVEMFQGYFLVMDDVEDGGTIRRGHPCWYLRPDVGMNAINDAILIYASLFETIRLYASHLPSYWQIIELFNETNILTAIGQHLDITKAYKQKDGFRLLTMERCDTLIKYKTSIYTYKLPVTLGMYLANISDPELHKKADNISFQLGYLYQMQDDYLDSYGVIDITGKKGTDIPVGKCTWLSVQALNRCNDEQRKIFLSCYGSSIPSDIATIKRLYAELKLREVYAQEERMRHDEVLRSVEELPKDTALPELFIKLLHMISKRNM